jgi:hypothetical protein
VKFWKTNIKNNQEPFLQNFGFDEQKCEKTEKQNLNENLSKKNCLSKAKSISSAIIFDTCSSRSESFYNTTSTSSSRNHLLKLQKTA